MCLGITTVLNKQTPEICFAGVLYTKHCDIDNMNDRAHRQCRHVIAVRKLASGWTWPDEFSDRVKDNRTVVLQNNEKSLIAGLCSQVQEIDPDVIIGHNVFAFDLEVLWARFHSLGLPFFHKFSRLKRRPPPRKGGAAPPGGMGAGRQLTIGRVVCDTYVQARDLLRNKINYKLSTLVQEMLGIDLPPPIVSQQVPQLYVDTRSLMYGLHSMHQVLAVTLQLMHKLQVLPLTRELTCLAGNLWFSSLQSKRAERNDWLLLHEFHNANFICPDKAPYSKQPSAGAVIADVADDDEAGGGHVAAAGGGKRKAAYLGGLVLEPKPGLYDTFVLVLDFNSLYPSIIQEFNICHTTVDRPDEKGDASFEVSEVMTKPGILPKILKRLVDKRRQVKQLLKRDTGDGMLKVREMALKLTANSLYGTIGYVHSRFHNTPIAAYITRQGRSILMQTKTRVENELRREVIYGDTDSIMINTGLADSLDNYKMALKISNEIKHSINKTHKKIEIDLDGVFKRLLLLKKKKYACVKVIDYANNQFTKENKGIDIVRRDWCGLTKVVGNKVLDIMFSNMKVDEVAGHIQTVLEATATDMDTGRIAMELYCITKGLTKMPEQYADSKTQPHVKVAKRLAQAGQSIKPGNEIPYIICDRQSIMDHFERSAGDEDMTSGADQKDDQVWQHFSDRAFSPEEVVKMSLTADVGWYKSQQLMPPIDRLCQYLGEGGQTTRIATSLGLDASKYSPVGADAETNEEHIDVLGRVMAALSISKEEQFKEVEINTEIGCQTCGEATRANELLKTFCCGSCGDWLPISCISNFLRTFIWMMFFHFHKFLHKCTECGVTTCRVGCDPDSLRCPQLQCRAGQALVPALTPRRVYLYLQHLKYLLEGDLEGENTVVKVMFYRNGHTQVLSHKHQHAKQLAQLDAKLDELVYLGEETIGIEEVDYNDRRHKLLGVVVDTISRNGYGHIEFSKIFAALVPPPAPHRTRIPKKEAADSDDFPID
eukprot:GHVS01077070.1.p1 GENE.GHVS01077070.1~~GHVS01077070.1.p1  ORF type:complete len:994 (+),score=171.39 GHVS01077070.1:532-3513(+)